MAAWRCMICLIFVSLTLKVLLSHINLTHGRSPDFWVHCGIDDCAQDFRVFNSFFRHIKRTHSSFLKNGEPPAGWRTTPTSHSMGLERFGVSVFENCRTIVTPPAPTPDEMRTNVTPSLHRLRSKLRKKRMLHHPQPTMMLLDLLPLLLSVSGNNATCHKKQSTTLCLEFNSTKLFSSMCFGRECRKFLSSILK
ncbi:hypothetical protein WMY93_026169 [Mugilogobius chulae]|uniref:C2H2-type domain-containing protein n=1 Tax=Mugilogobius chulae TaxID=88201 RepID=A0AAW0N7N4_9GOBI